MNSRQSSLGVYRTAETYQGKHGYSLRLDGLSPGKNSNARKRAIVVHGADYASPRHLQKYDKLGRSWGCPALPREQSRAIIDIIKGECHLCPRLRRVPRAIQGKKASKCWPSVVRWKGDYLRTTSTGQGA